MNAARWITIRIRSFVFGISLPLRSVKTILSDPMLFFLSLLPIAITLALYKFFIEQMQRSAQLALGQTFTHLGISQTGFLLQVLVIFTKLLLFLLSAFTFSFAAGIIACPFNDFLAERAEKTAAPPLPPAPRYEILGRLKILGIDITKTASAAGMSLLAVLFSWIPAVNILALIFTFLLTCFQYISYPQTRRGLGLGAGAGFIVRHFFACTGFGFVFSLLLAIPILSSFCLPLAIVGGTLLVARAPGDKNEFPLC